MRSLSSSSLKRFDAGKLLILKKKLKVQEAQDIYKRFHYRHDISLSSLEDFEQKSLRSAWWRAIKALHGRLLTPFQWELPIPPAKLLYLPYYVLNAKAKIKFRAELGFDHMEHSEEHGEYQATRWHINGPSTKWESVTRRYGLDNPRQQPPENFEDLFRRLENPLAICYAGYSYRRKALPNNDPGLLFAGCDLKDHESWESKKSIKKLMKERSEDSSFDCENYAIDPCTLDATTVKNERFLSYFTSNERKRAEMYLMSKHDADRLRNLEISFDFEHFNVDKFYLPVYYFENHWNYMILSTYVSAVTGKCFSTRLYSPTKAAMLTAALVGTGYQGWDNLHPLLEWFNLKGSASDTSGSILEAGSSTEIGTAGSILESGTSDKISATTAASLGSEPSTEISTTLPEAETSVNQASKFFDLFISSATAGACTWYYPQLFLLEMDDDREKERKAHPVPTSFYSETPASETNPPSQTNRHSEHKTATQNNTASTSTNNEGSKPTERPSVHRNTTRNFRRRVTPPPEAEQWQKFRQTFDRQSEPSDSKQKNSTFDSFIADEQTRIQKDPSGYFAFLDVDPDASMTDIRIAFRKQALKYHPDKYQDENDKKVAHEKFQELVRIYNVLRDPIKRKKYIETGSG